MESNTSFGGSLHSLIAGAQFFDIGFDLPTSKLFPLLLQTANKFRGHLEWLHEQGKK